MKTQYDYWKESHDQVMKEMAAMQITYTVSDTIPNEYFKYIIDIGKMLDFHAVRKWMSDTYGYTEDLKNYLEIQNWMRGLGYPESLEEIYTFQKTGNINAKLDSQRQLGLFSDGTLQVLTNSSIPNFQVVFKDLFPYSLGTLSFDATSTDIQYFTADVSFKYTIYNITDLSGNNL